MPKAYQQSDPNIPIEYCVKCDGLTGKAGRGEDSLYFGNHGPFCEGCYTLMHDVHLPKLIDAILIFVTRRHGSTIEDLF